MAVPAPAHQCRVFGAPWPGVHATEITSGRHYPRHAHATFGFGVVDAGAHRSASAKGTVDAFAGDIVTTNPGEVHDGRPLGGPTRHWHTVYLEPEVLAGLRTEACGTDVMITRPVIADRQLQRATRTLLARLRHWQQGRAEALACEEALVAACGLLLDRHTTARPAADPAPARLDRVRERLADALLQPPSLAELAALAGLSRFQLLRRFAAMHGLTPHAWLLHQRTERVRALVARGTPLADAALATGFADQSHMTRVFTRQYGFTPGAWQRATAGPQ